MFQDVKQVSPHKYDVLIITKEIGVETKVENLENNHKNEIDELKNEINMLQTKTEKLLNTQRDNVEEPHEIVLKELKGRNLTIFKSKTENNPTKTDTSSKLSDEENIVAKNIEATDKAKPKRIKITKKIIEDRLISAYVLDA